MFHLSWIFKPKQIPVGLIASVFLGFISAGFSAEDAAKVIVPEAVSKSLPIAGEVFSVSGHVAFLISPKAAAVKSPTTWIMYAPTLTGLPGPEEKWMFERFLKNRIAIAGIDVGESYGNSTGRALYTLLYEELVQNRGYLPKATLLPRSRGGLMLYNWAAEHPDWIACVAGIYPVCDLSSYPGLATAAPAYKMTKDQLAAHLAENNPIDRLEGLAKAHVPIFHIHGDVDTVVPLERNSAELARRYWALGGEMTLLIAKDQGHNMWSGFFQCLELMNFVYDYAGGNKLSAAPLSE